MNFAETAVKDQSAEQSPSPAGPYPQEDSHSWPWAIAAGNSHGAQMDPKTVFLPSTGVRLGYRGTAQITGESPPHAQDQGWHCAFPAAPQSSPQSRPFYG